MVIGYTTEKLDSMSDGEYYYAMLFATGMEWAAEANRKMKLNLDKDKEHALGGWFCSACMAMVDRDNADYIRARIDYEYYEDQAHRNSERD